MATNPMNRGVQQLLAKLKFSLALVVALAITSMGVGLTHRLLRTEAAGTAESVQSPPPAVSGDKLPAGKKSEAAEAAKRRSQEILDEALRELEASEQRSKSTINAELRADMAGVQVRLGDRDAAKKLFEQASAVVAALPFNNSSQWLKLTHTAAEAGALEEALAAAGRIPKGDQYHETGYYYVATAMARQRREKDVRRVLAMIDEGQSRPAFSSGPLAQLALAHAAAGDIPAALRIVERLPDPASQVQVLAGRLFLDKSTVDYPYQPGVAILQARSGDKAAARKTLERVAELVASIPPDNKARPIRAATPLTALACAQATIGEFAAARKTADAIPIANKVAKSVAVAALVRQLAQAGRTEEARTEVERLTGVIQVHALMHYGAALAQSGDRKSAAASFERAHVLLDEVTLKNGRDSLAHALSALRADAGDFKGAMQTAGAYLEQDSLGYNTIAGIQAEAGDFAGALKVYDRLKRSGGNGWDLQLLRRIAKTQAERGESKAALEWIARLGSHMERACALVGVADGIARAQAAPKEHTGNARDRN